MGGFVGSSLCSSSCRTRIGAQLLGSEARWLRSNLFTHLRSGHEDNRHLSLHFSEEGAVGPGGPGPAGGRGSHLALVLPLLSLPQLPASPVGLLAPSPVTGDWLTFPVPGILSLFSSTPGKLTQWADAHGPGPVTPLTRMVALSKLPTLSEPHPLIDIMGTTVPPMCGSTQDT